MKSETPDDIMQMDVDDVWKLVQDEEGGKLPKPRIRLNYVKMLYDVLGLTLTPDVALASIAMPRSILSISPAGGGKTTWAQVQAIMYKLLYPDILCPMRKVPGRKILCLVYNTHNVKDMEDRHARLITRLRVANIDGLDIDDEINASTMHSFCDFIRKQNLAKLGMVGSNLLNEDAAINMMERSANIAFLKLKIHVNSPISPQNLLGFYNLCKESMLSVEEMQDCDKFQDIGLEDWVVDAIFKQFESAKKLGRKYDYVDMLTSVADLLESDQRVLSDVQRYYQVIIADEVQDFTPIMWKILKLLVSNGTPLTCIGDEDQCIYRFRGASMRELLEFPQIFDGGKVYSLLINRRCRKEILNEAVSVISENTQRFDKSLVGIKDGGRIETVPYSTVEGQILNVAGRLKQLDTKQLEKSVCCFRDNKCAQLLIDVLEEEKIPYHSIQNAKPFSHELYKHVIDVLNALELPYDRDVTINLYKVLPCHKKQMFQIFGYDAKKRRFTKPDDKLHFAQYDYGNVMSISGFGEVMLRLVQISKAIKTEPLNNYVGEIFSLLNKYYWNYRKEMRNEDTLDEIFDKRVREFFDSEKPYPAFFDSYRKRIAACTKNCESGYGVALSTFHGLKGLEYENVFALFMEDSIFPNFPLIESKGYRPEVTLDLKESETRLWYVVVTRAITKLTIYYSQTEPSKYVQDYFDRKNGVYVKPFKPTEQISFRGSGGDSGGDFEDDFEDDFEVDFEQIVQSEQSAPEKEKHIVPDKSAFEKTEKLKVSSGSRNFLSSLINGL